MSSSPASASEPSKRWSGSPGKAYYSKQLAATHVHSATWEANVQDAECAAPLEDDFATVFNMMKAIMGAGGFAMPWAFARLGMLGGFFAIAFCTLFGWWTVGELAQLKEHVEETQGGRPVTYVDVARAALGNRGAEMVFLLTLVCSLGVTSAYLVFIAATIHSMLPAVSQASVVLVAAAVVLPITWVPSFSLLSKLAQSGTLAVIVGYGVTLLYGASTVAQPGATPPPPAPYLGSLAGAASGFGPVAFLFCVHFLLFPVMTASRAATQKGGFQRLALTAFGTAAVINGLFGAICLRFFGVAVSSIVVNDIAQGSLWLTATKCLLCVDLFCSYPLVFASGREILEGCLLDWDEGAAMARVLAMGHGLQERTVTHRRYMIRSLMVLANVAIAQLEDFGTIISLVGSLAQVSLAFVLPPIMAVQLLGANMPARRRAINMTMIPVGVCLATLATGATVAEALGVDLSSY
mmetsp:Transcript_21952/g.51348  ORF Transcript_21952/g.51348 Transcript_21952/m.51348 type:complete len:465 (-) Transcript_21952:388-1782(-)|eukprot:CAMPEP_0178468012 /NCGR_PEP_ID=MMETSP0689_2-20121128/52703_1 /TAXON_ID=160604 /ORGANISM="Amphidinium massartii, Strain CS-259" /LENGTH=464 /DNA_ID=CAMNT_0020095061 /DNA_START=8 /DNA_END=1402 /DNA_ORIENTATION=-